MMQILITRKVKVPTRGTPGSAGIDFYVPEDFKPVKLRPGESVNIPSGISAVVPEDYALIAFNKSGVALKKSLQVGACVVDSDYTGEIHLHVFNVGKKEQEIMPGDKLVQFLLIPVWHCDIEIISRDTRITERGAGGFGSTGE